MSQYHAYFIGGPEDLTKRVFRHPIPVYQFAELPDMETDILEPDAPIEPVSFDLHQYELQSRHRCFKTNNDILIYIYSGKRS